MSPITARIKSFAIKYEPRVGVADAGGELAERAGGAGVAVGAEQHFAGPRVAFFRQRDVAHALVAVGADVVEVRQVLFLGEVAEHVHVAVRHRIFREDVVVRNDDELLLVPHFSGLAEVLLEDANGARPAHVVRHQHIDVGPDVLARRDEILAAGPGQNLLGHGHRRGHMTKLHRRVLKRVSAV